MGVWASTACHCSTSTHTIIAPKRNGNWISKIVLDPM
jgi:hypothetical protein